MSFKLQLCIGNAVAKSYLMTLHKKRLNLGGRRGDQTSKGFTASAADSQPQKTSKAASVAHYIENVIQYTPSYLA